MWLAGGCWGICLVLVLLWFSRAILMFVYWTISCRACSRFLFATSRVLPSRAGLRPGASTNSLHTLPSSIWILDFRRLSVPGSTAQTFLPRVHTSP
jgi:hypothetical protein